MIHWLVLTIIILIPLIWLKNVVKSRYLRRKYQLMYVKMKELNKKLHDKEH